MRCTAPWRRTSAACRRCSPSRSARTGCATRWNSTRSTTSQAESRAMKTAELFDVRGLATVITGGAGGIGRAYAEAMLDNGARVRLLDRDATRLEAAVAELRSRGAVDGATVDVSDRTALRAAID